MRKLLLAGLVFGVIGCTPYVKSEREEPFVILNYTGTTYVFADLQNTRTGKIYYDVFIGKFCNMSDLRLRKTFIVQMVSYKNVNTNETGDSQFGDLSDVCDSNVRPYP